MRNAFVALAVAASFVALGSTALAKVETVKGQLVDQGCYKRDNSNTGETHKMPNGPMDNCATACAKMGRPVALLTADRKLYEITGDLAANKNEKLVAHMSHTVEVTGDVTMAEDGTMKIAATGLKMISK